ncbi:hypothetical protein CEP52_016834 [Fusarium oligoseptatum]|uniref:Zn(2)-C6 fungal-type domain-containing protein n=1 Tax=Fusarium oligoseptatum TaxID=2604345 RepID=A0A428RZK1_9HYPO|nr:hypothetical protein CEP52_016834 [Fusarium oligoseptatum]
MRTSRYTRQACDNCRRRKIKCDSQPPQCANCRSSNLECEYSLVRRKRGPKPRVSMPTPEIPSPSMSEHPDQVVTVTASLTPRDEDVEEAERSTERTPFVTSLPLSSPGQEYRPVPVPEVTTLQTPSADTTASFEFRPARGSSSAVGLSLPLGHYPHNIHETLTSAIENLGLPLEQTVRQCLCLYMEHPHFLACYLMTLSGQGLASTICALFTLVTSACANICSKIPTSVFTPDSKLVHHFLAASRGMLMCYEDQDVAHPDSSSLSIRVFQAVALHSLGKIRLSWYVLGHALRLALVMRLFDKASYSHLDQVEAQLRKNAFWILYVSDKSASVLNNVPTTLHDAHLDGSLLTVVSADQDEDQPCLLEDAEEPLYKAPYESQIHIGFRLSQRLWSLAADLLHDIRILSRLNSKTSSISGPPSIDSFQQGIIQSYMAFCSVLDAMPPWLCDPGSHTVQDAEQSITNFRRRTFWIQRANLLVTFHCLRLVLLREASAQGFSAILGVTNDPDMLALRNTEISHELIAIVTCTPFEALQANGEPLGMPLTGPSSSAYMLRARNTYLSTQAIQWSHQEASSLLRLNTTVAFFYIVCTNAGHGGKTLRTDNFVISTTDIWSNNWSDPIPIPFKGIDPGLFFDDDGRVYFHGCFLLDRTKQPSCTITQFEINIETGEPISEQREIWQGHARYDTEGPHIYKLGKWYYLLVAEGGTFEHHMLCISRSESVWGPYEDFKGNPILTADGKDDEYIQNTGHGELFQDSNGQWWAAVFGCEEREILSASGKRDVPHTCALA